uniref:Uncharacterized protein n=1 Tax=Oryza brachyantha TaxID=4533 RepID=J3LDT3_ORYBR
MPSTGHSVHCFQRVQTPRCSTSSSSSSSSCVAPSSASSTHPLSTMTTNTSPCKKNNLQIIFIFAKKKELLKPLFTKKRWTRLFASAYIYKLKFKYLIFNLYILGFFNYSLFFSLNFEIPMKMYTKILGINYFLFTNMSFELFVK